MSDWQKGDLALCVKVGPWRFLEEPSEERAGPRAGRILTVRVVNFCGHAALKFVDFPDDPDPDWLGFHASRFRKVTPPKDMKLDSEEIAKPEQVPA